MRRIGRWILERTGLDNVVYGVQYVRSLQKVRQLMQLDGHELQQFRDRRLREMIRYAYDNVELYNRKWRRAGVHPDDIRTVADLKKLPIVTKDDLRRGFPDAILSRKCRREDCYTVGTSGSTGTPVRVFVDRDKAMLDFALNEPAYMGGMPPMTVGRAVRDFLVRRNILYMTILVKNELAYESLYGRIFWVMRHSVVDCLQSPDFHVTEINRRRPEYIYSYASVVHNVCIAARDRGIRMHRPKLIIVTGEVADNHLRSLVKETFGTELLDSYGTIEVGFIACECPKHEGLHIFDWKVVLELLDQDGEDVADGEAGSVVVTDLFNRATPLIRYGGLGDYAVRKGGLCSCGRPLPLLARVEGRMVDSVVLPNGRTVHPYSLTLALEDIPYLSKFQIRQEQPDYIRVLLVKEKTPSAESVSFARDGCFGQNILDRFGSILNHQVNVDIEVVEDIPRKPGHHKYPTVVSLVKRR